MWLKVAEFKQKLQDLRISSAQVWDRIYDIASGCTSGCTCRYWKGYLLVIIG